MIKVLRREDIKEEFNSFHRFIKKRNTRKTIKNFNRCFKVAVESGKKWVAVQDIVPIHVLTYTGRVERAIEEGVSEGIHNIAEIYPTVENNYGKRFVLYFVIEEKEE